MLLAICCFALAGSTTDLPADQGLWVYAHNGDPGRQETLRIWGSSGQATPEGQGESEDFGYGYLRWDVSKLPAGPPKTAVLVLHNINPPSFKNVDKTTPLQARGLVGIFSADTWDYSMSLQVHPDLAKTVFGAALPKPWGASKDPIEIDIDLMKGPGAFKAYLLAAQSSKDHALCLALTSAIDPNTDNGPTIGASGIYKVYSAIPANKDKRPVLKLGY